MSKGDLKKRKKKGGSKKKGVVYVADRLQKYYKTDYSVSGKNTVNTSAKQAKEKARNRAKEIITELKAQKKPVTWANAKELEKQLRDAKLDRNRIKKGIEPKDKPVFPDEMIRRKQEVYHYEADPVVLDLIEISDPRIHFVSDFFEDVFTGGQYLDYYDSGFKDVVDQIDTIKKEEGISYVFFVFSNIYFNNISKQFESRIFIKDDNNNSLQVDTAQSKERGEIKITAPKEAEATKKEEPKTESNESAKEKSAVEEEIELTKARTEEIKAKTEYIKELKSLGLSIDEIKKLLGL